MNSTHWATFISFFNSSKIFYHIHEDEALNYTSVRFCLHKAIRDCPLQWAPVQFLKNWKTCIFSVMRTVNLFRQNSRRKGKLISSKSSFSIWILKLCQKYWKEEKYWKDQVTLTTKRLIIFLVMRRSVKRNVEGTRFIGHWRPFDSTVVVDRGWLRPCSRIYFFVSVSYNYQNNKWMQEELNGTKTEVPVTGKDALKIKIKC